MTFDDKLASLRAILAGYGRVAICFSGGVDSAFLLHVAVHTLGRDNVLALTATSENFPAWEAAEAHTFAATLGCRHETVVFDPLALPQFADNVPDRCYHCKKALFSELRQLAGILDFAVLADGTNQDDMDDYRPGMRAVRELGVASPLLTAGIGKDVIRHASKEMGLPFWRKPSFACLASRFPYGETITRDKLVQVAEAEQYFLDLGFANIRVRHHGDIARIEVDRSERGRFFSEELMDRVQAELKRLGFTYITLDLGGYRTGSMNTVL